MSRELGLPSGSPSETSKPASSKRSWLRVARRVLARGRASYHGHWFRRSMISEQDIRRAQRYAPYGHQQSGRHSRKNRSSHPRSRCSSHHGSGCTKFLSVNTGGLPSHKLDELLFWCSEQKIELLAVQETRWNSSLQWESAGWSLIHSGPNSPKQSYCGILFGFKGHAVIRYDEIIEGRLLRVQLTSRDRPLPLEIVVGYNHVVLDEASAEAHDAALQARHAFWTALDRTICSIPRRHALLVLGDFNVHVGISLPGCAVSDPSGRCSPDEEMFQELLSRHSLRVQNSGKGAHGVSFRSSMQSTRGTRPDYALVRANMVQCTSHVTVSWSAPFLVPNEFGWHGALQGTLRRNWTPWMSSRPLANRPPSFNHDLLRQAQHPEHSHHGLYLQKLASLLGEREHSIDSLSACVYQAGLAVFASSMGSRRKIPAWKTTEVQSLCRQKWGQYSMIRRLTNPHSLRDFFLCWRTVSSYWHVSRMCQRVSRTARRTWLRSLCAEAEQTGIKKDHAFFSVIRKLAPKSTRTPLGVRCKLHGAESIEEEIDRFEQHYSHLFQAGCPKDILVDAHWQWNSTPTCDDLQDAFQRIPLVKAVPPLQPLGGIWRLALGLPRLRSCMDAILASLPKTGIPTQFSNGLLTLLPKPGRSGKEVTHYRPLVIQCCIGKAILRWIARRVLLVVRPLLYSHPQFCLSSSA